MKRFNSFYLTHKIKKLNFLYSRTRADYGLMKDWSREVDPHIPNHSNPQQLRLLLGVNRSGTTWMGEVLSRTSSPIRYFMEGLQYIKPLLQFTPVDDRLSISYHPELNLSHPLTKAYKAFLATNKGLDALNLTSCTHRNDLDYHYCLTKQVHSILATDGLLKVLNTKAILLVRDPVYVVDSLLSRDHLKSYSLTNEWKYIQDEDFLNEFHPTRKKELLKTFKALNGIFPNRYTIILRKVFTVALINEMLVQLAEKYRSLCLLVRYEKLLENPEEIFESCAKHFGLNWDEQIVSFLEKTTRNKNDNSTRMPIFRDQKAQHNRPFKFITDQETKKIRAFLTNLDLYKYK